MTHPYILKLPPNPTLEQYSQFGSYWGGILGPILTFVSILLILITIWQSKKSAYKDTIINLYTEMLSTHDGIVDSIKLDKYSGRDVFSKFLKDFYRIFNIVNKCCSEFNCDLDIYGRVDIAYTFCYYGPSLTIIPEMSIYRSDLIKKISDSISEMLNRDISRKRNEILRPGYQNILTHYYRNMFGAFQLLNKSKLKKKDKYILAKALRSKLTNYEQACLALNITSHFGHDWKSSGILDRFSPIKNIPENFFTFTLSDKVRDLFPTTIFEWQERNQTHSHKMVLKFFRITLIVHRSRG